MAIDVSSHSLFDVWRVEGEELGVDLDGLGVDQAAGQVAQEGVVRLLGHGRRGRRGRRNALLQDLEALVQVVLQRYHTLLSRGIHELFLQSERVLQKQIVHRAGLKSAPQVARILEAS